MTNVSVLGLGMMGSRLAQLLRHSGREVTVWNRTTARSAALRGEGVTVASTPGTAIAASDTIVICVHDYAAARDILGTASSAGALDGRLIIHLSTGSPQEARDMLAWADRQGAHYIEGAIQAAPEQMGKADTPILVSGAQSAFDRSQPVLQVFGQNLSYLGANIGAANAMDTATLSCLYGSLIGFFHGARVCEAEGFSVKAYASIVAGITPTFGDFLRHEGEVIESGNFAISASPLKISIEATARLERLARDAGINAEFPAFVAALLKRTMDAGYADEELAAVIKLLRKKQE